MPITETARKNHEMLFPNNQSTLKRTDPELVEVFDNFAFDEVLRHGDLDTKTRLMAILASLIAQQTLAEYKVMLGGALNVGLTPIEVKEFLYHAVPYVGMARVFDLLNATNEVLRARGIALPLEGQSTTTAGTRSDKGLAVQRQLFGDRIDRMHRESPTDQVHIQRFLTSNCFGDFYTRTGLDLKTRELLTFSMLAALGGCESQVAAHVAANLAVGNNRAVLVSTVTQLLPFIGYPRTLNALRAINEGTSP